MNLNKFRGLLRNSTMLVKRTMEECDENFAKSMSQGDMHQFLYNKVDVYLRDNGIKADRKTINVLTDNGKEMFVNQTISDMFIVKKDEVIQ